MSDHARAVCVVRAVALILVCGPAAAAAQSLGQCASPAAAVRYVEHPEGGPDRDAGRTLSTNGGASYGVDINSRIDILVDRDCLASQLNPELFSAATRQRATTLRGRMMALDALAKGLGVVVGLENQAARDFSSASTSPEVVRSSAIPVERAELNVLLNLKGLMIARVLDEREQRTPGVPPDRLALTRTDTQAVERRFDDVFVPGRLDFEAIRDTIISEINQVQRRLDALPDPETTVAIEAFLSSDGGQPVPIYLPQYNTVQEGPDARVVKIEMGVSTEQLALLEQYTKTAATMSTTKNAADAVTDALREQFRIIKDQLNPSLQQLEAAFAREESAGRKFATVANGATITSVLDAVDATLKAAPEGKELSEQWKNARMVIDTLRMSYEALHALTGVRAQLANADPATALTIVLHASETVSLPLAEMRSGQPLQLPLWNERLRTARSFLTKLATVAPQLKQQLEKDDKLSAVTGLLDASTNLSAELSRTSVAAREWLTRALGSGASSAMSELPEVPGQTRLPITRDMNTTLRLRTIAAKRKEGDHVQVSYTFFKREAPLPAAWHDDFQLREYGTLARSVAGLAFVRQIGGESTFTPTASLSWMATYRCWPGESGIGRLACPFGSSSSGLGSLVRGFGIGFSTMSLGFDSAQKVQIGLAGTMSFIDDRILGGVGRNLQAQTKPWFSFFSVRLFSAGGNLGGQ